MRQYSLDSKLVRPANRFTGTLLLFAILIASCISSVKPTTNLEQGTLSNVDFNSHLDELNHTTSTVNLGNAISLKSTPSVRGDRLSSVGKVENPVINDNYKQSTISESEKLKPRDPKPRRQSDVLSRDCFAKRNEVLRRQNHVAPSQVRPSAPANVPAGFQRIRPKVGNIPSAPPSLNLTILANNSEGEHVPRCRQDGSYDPVQCHKIGYCWCVNKYGQAIKNSAIEGGEPECNLSLYDSDNHNRLVVAGISAQRVRGLLKPGGSNFASSTPNGNIDFEATEPTSTEPSSDTDDGHQQAESTSRPGAPGPVMALIPNDCSGSRSKARERAATQITDTIWVPDCDNDDEKLYAEQQCHLSKVCWCVDQATGLPLRTNDQVFNGPMTHNCTEIKRILGLKTIVASKPSLTPETKQQPHQMAFYQGSSEFCDADKRLEFVLSLNNQFRQQISEYLRQHPSSSVPSDLSSSNPYLISESQVSRWKFSIIDLDKDGKIGDREWSKFKNNFKLIDKVSELDNPFKQQKSPYYLLAPLLIVRSQRKCWRDFLEFCGNGELIDESISLSMWQSCTEVPARSSLDEPTNPAPISSTENSYAMSRKAAIVRSQKKNPFLGILKPD